MGNTVDTLRKRKKHSLKNLKMYYNRILILKDQMQFGVQI